MITWFGSSLQKMKKKCQKITCQEGEREKEEVLLGNKWENGESFEFWYGFLILVKEMKLWNGGREKRNRI